MCGADVSHNTTLEPQHELKSTGIVSSLCYLLVVQVNVSFLFL